MRILTEFLRTRVGQREVLLTAEVFVESFEKARRGLSEEFVKRSLESLSRLPKTGVVAYHYLRRATRLSVQQRQPDPHRMPQRVRP